MTPSRIPWRGWSTAMVGCLALTFTLLALPVRSAAAQDWDGTQQLVLGDDATSTFNGGMLAERHLYKFFAPAGTKVNVTAKADKGVALTPALRLLKDGNVIDLGKKLKLKSSKSQIANFKLEVSGWYEIEVTATEGTGSYSLKTKASKLGKSAKGIQTTGEYMFEAVGGSLLKLATIKGSKGVKPVFTGLFGPSGDEIDVLGLPFKKIKKIELPATGTYTLTYAENPGAKLQPGEVKVSVKVTPLKSREAFGNATGQMLQKLGTMDAGDPHNGTASPGYLGTEACRQCHGEYVENVLDSFHNSKMRNTFRSGAAGYNVPPGIDAMFRAPGGTDLKTTQAPTFDAVQGDLHISYVEGAERPYRIKVGNRTYEVMYLMGGNGPWKQRYVVKIGQSHYITPVQYNDKVKTFAAYHPGDWDLDGPTAPKNSWERRCGACHSTGLTVSFDAGTGEYLTGYAQMNVGCEACHGAGAAHVASQSADDILNPRDLLDGTVEGVQKAELTCGQCHHRGSGGLLAGSPSATGYPLNVDDGLFAPRGRVRSLLHHRNGPVLPREGQPDGVRPDAGRPNGRHLPRIEEAPPAVPGRAERSARPRQGLRRCLLRLPRPAREQGSQAHGHRDSRAWRSHLHRHRERQQQAVHRVPRDAWRFHQRHRGRRGSNHRHLHTSHREGRGRRAHDGQGCHADRHRGLRPRW